MQEVKTLKQYAKEAKQRLKSGFWQNYNKDLNKSIEQAKEDGVAVSLVKEYYSVKVKEELREKDNEGEKFYVKVKNLLDTEGEVSDAIGRLTDKEEFEKLSYEERQRYTLSLSEKYLKAVERYKKEKLIKKA